MVLGCTSGTRPPPASPPSDVYADVTARAGIDFVHVNGGSGERYLPETMGAGGGFFDYDNDGWLDIYLVQGAALPGFPVAATPPSDRLLRNRHDGTFEDVTAAAGINETAYGQGVCFGDVNNDGWTDIYVANFGPNTLYLNRGDGSFEDVSPAAGVADAAWGTSCAFADYDGDGWLDLYVANYVAFTIAGHVHCGTPAVPQYCHPDAYLGAPDVLYHNRGNGTFEDLTRASGALNGDPREDKGLGVAWFDYDNDGRPDLFVANDSTRNFLYHNLGGGKFKDEAALAGCAYNGRGQTQANMGIAVGDYDRNGSFDLFVTHLDFEENTLWQNRGGSYDDRTAQVGLAAPGYTLVGFGTGFVDYDNDGDLDLFVANGHIIDNIALAKPELSYAQPPLLLENTGSGRFEDVSARAGAYFKKTWVSRGAAFGDYDNDGDIDILVTSNNRAAVLLRNDSPPGNNWVTLRLVSRHGGRDAIGARATLKAGALTQTDEVRSGTSYESQNDLRLHFGLGKIGRGYSLELRWPEGQVQTIPGAEVPVNRITTIRQAD